MTFPNQKKVVIHREKVERDFLGISNDNWNAACRDLGAHAAILYLYFASNADKFNLALSPVAVEEAIGMPRSTYYDQLNKLIKKGYIVKRKGNIYDFYETPQNKNTE